MSTTVTQGKARLYRITASAAGVPNLTAPATVGASNGAIIRVAMDPSDNRRFGVLGLAVGSTNANPQCGGVTGHMLVNVVASPPPPPIDSVTVDESGEGGEVDPATLPWL